MKENSSKAKTLRKNMTKEERKLWYEFFKLTPYTVNRQKAIGPYIVDFYCHEAKLIIELDGSQHFEEDGKIKDGIRDDFFKKKNIFVLRYSNYDVNTNFDGVCYDILKNIKERIDC